MANHNGRLSQLESDLRRDWRYLLSLPWGELGLDELDVVVAHVAPDMDRLMWRLTIPQLEALADGDLSLVSDEERAILEDGDRKMNQAAALVRQGGIFDVT